MEKRNLFSRVLSKTRHISGLLDSLVALALVIIIMTISSNAQAAAMTLGPGL